jgi:uncharacterized protein
LTSDFSTPLPNTDPWLSGFISAPWIMNYDIYIRDAGSDDIADVLAINAGASPGVSYLDANTAKSLITLASLAWVAVLRDQIVGYLIGFLSSSSYDGEEFRWFKHRGGNFIYVDQIAIARGFRGCGIGRRLYAELYGWGYANACRAIACEVNLMPPNPDSLAFHTGGGFNEVGQLVCADRRRVVLLERRFHCEGPDA